MYFLESNTFTSILCHHSPDEEMSVNYKYITTFFTRNLKFNFTRFILIEYFCKHKIIKQKCSR